MKKFVLSPCLNKRLISTLMSSRSTDSNKSQSFTLKCTNDFASRSGNIFGELQTLEKNHEVWMSENKTLEPLEESEDCVKPPNDSEIFKKPLPAKKWKRKSNFISQPEKRNRKKWTKYSLEDIPISTDAKNTAIALQFINDLRMQKAKTSDIEHDGSEKIVFRKPKRIGSSATSQASLSTLSEDGNSSSPSLPHIKKQKTDIDKKDTEQGGIKLDHLHDEDNESVQ